MHFALVDWNLAKQSFLNGSYEMHEITANKSSSVYQTIFVTFYLFQKYEIPGAKDIPIDFRVYIEKNSENPLGILRSKGKMTFLQVYSISNSSR